VWAFSCPPLCVSQTVSAASLWVWLGSNRLNSSWLLGTLRLSGRFHTHTFVLIGQDSKALAAENKGNDNEVTETQPVAKSARTPAVLGRFAILSFDPHTQESTVKYYTRFQAFPTLFTSLSDSAQSAVQHLLTTTAFNTFRHLEAENGKNLHNPYFVTMHAKIPISYSAVERTQ